MVLREQSPPGEVSVPQKKPRDPAMHDEMKAKAGVGLQRHLELQENPGFIYKEGNC